MATQQKREIQRGTWLYDGRILKGVIIQAINYDYWYDLEASDGFDMSDEEPELNDQGEMYMIEWMNASFTKQESFSVGLFDLQATVELAQSIIKQPIKWL
ncbi:MAG: hypothetical protein ACRYG7_06920 [Janthinobacterium lividum]